MALVAAEAEAPAPCPLQEKFIRMLPKWQETMSLEHPEREGVKLFPIQGRHTASGFKLGCVACNATGQHKDSWGDFKIGTIHMCQKAALQKHLH